MDFFYSLNFYSVELHSSLGNRSLKFLINLKLWCMRVLQVSSVIEVLIHV
jgi:hypothetical protein